MELLQVAVGFEERINEIAFLLSIFVTALFYAEYKKYNYELEKEEMLDNFLQD